MTSAQVEQRLNIDAARAAAALRDLAYAGQVIYDLSAKVYRWRQIMPKAVGEAEIGPEHPELAGSREILRRNLVELETRVDAPVAAGAAPGSAGYIITGKAERNPVEILIDTDQRIRKGKCVCTYYRKFAMKNGPCRHMLALRGRATIGAMEAYQQSGWYNRLLGRK
jgi:hypothetical protein